MGRRIGIRAGGGRSVLGGVTRLEKQRKCRTMGSAGLRAPADATRSFVMSMRGLLIGGVVAVGLGGIFGSRAMAGDFRDGRDGLDAYRVEVDRGQVWRGEDVHRDFDDDDHGRYVLRDEVRDRDHDRGDRHEVERGHHEDFGHDRR